MRYFSRLELIRSGAEVPRLLNLLSADDYKHHQTVWKLFEGVGARDFIYRRESIGRWPRYYVVSRREPRDTEGLWDIEVKPYYPRIREGTVLAFSLRANPTITRKSSSGKRFRHDVVMDRKRTIGFKSLPASERPPLQSIVRDAGLDWLASRAAKHGFRFQEGHVTVDGYEQHHSLKRNGGKPISFSTLDFGGLLTVTDTSAFQEALFSGIGPAKGLGCGMLMVRRV